VKLCDFSPSGCKFEFVDRPAVGEVVWVKFEGIDGFEGSVCWVEGRAAGVEFRREIYMPVFEHLVRKLAPPAAR